MTLRGKTSEEELEAYFNLSCLYLYISWRFLSGNIGKEKSVVLLSNIGVILVILCNIYHNKLVILGEILFLWNQAPKENQA